MPRLRDGLPRTRVQWVLLLASALACSGTVLLLLSGSPAAPPQTGSELLGTWEEPHGIGIDEEPWSAPRNLWLYWGSTTNRRFTGSGEKIRHIFKMGNVEGGEWRDPKFLRKITGSLFRRMSERCCITMLFPPFEWDFPIYNPSKAIAQRMRSFVANGNAMVFTGGMLDYEFINRYFFYQLEPSDGNYSPGPFPLLPDWQGLSPKQKGYLKPAPRILPQKGISVTAIKKQSLPQGSTVIYASPHNTPVFLIKFCMADNPMNEPSVTYPPVKVLPRDCPASAKAGRPCSCGNICYLGYNYVEQYPGRWDDTLKIMVDLCSEVPPENFNPKNYFPPGDLEAAKAAGCAQEPDAAGCEQAQEQGEEEGWQGNYKLGNEDSDEEKEEHIRWADGVETRRMGGGLGGSTAGVIVDNPNNPNAVGPVRGTQINRPQTQFHSVVRQGNAAAEPTLVAKDVSKIQVRLCPRVQPLAMCTVFGAPNTALLYTRACLMTFPAPFHFPCCAFRFFSSQNLHLEPKKVSWRPGRAGKRGRSERVARARAAFDKASGVDTEALQGSHKGCGPLCQLRLFVQDNRKIAADAHLK